MEGAEAQLTLKILRSYARISAEATGAAEMDVETKVELVRSVGEEVITVEDLRALFETKEHPVAYDGFEPSGLAHLPLGVYRPLLLRRMMEAGVRFKLLLADTFAWINNKFGGDLERIRRAGEYFIEVWRAAGVDMSKVEVLWHKDFFDDPDYWKKVLLIAKAHTLTRTRRALTIAGRLGYEEQPAAFFFYPSMQAADIFHMRVDICQLGLDQRKVNILARELAHKKVGGQPLYKLLGYEGCGVEGKPVLVHHHMLPGLRPPIEELRGYDENPAYNRAIAWKMSKSKPETCIYVHDSREEIFRKVKMAYCPAKVVENNPILDYVKEIIFRAFTEFTVERPAKYGGTVTYYSYAEVERDFREGKLHPLDLKMAVAEHLDRLIAPIREHFEKSKRARELYELVRSFEVTR